MAQSYIERVRQQRKLERFEKWRRPVSNIEPLPIEAYLLEPEVAEPVPVDETVGFQIDTPALEPLSQYFVHYVTGGIKPANIYKNELPGPYRGYAQRDWVYYGNKFLSEHLPKIVSALPFETRDEIMQRAYGNIKRMLKLEV